MPLIIKRNDTTTERFVLESPPGTPVDLTGAALTFLMRLTGTTTLKINATPSVEDPEGGEVDYTFLPADSDTDGEYEASIKAIFPDGTQRTFPSSGFIRIVIGEVIG